MKSQKHKPTLPAAPRSIQKGSSLKDLLSEEAIAYLASNIAIEHPKFDMAGFQKTALTGLGPLGILERGHHIAAALKRFLPPVYEDAIAVMLESLTEPLVATDDLGLGVFFYLPHVCFVSNYGLNKTYNKDRDPFETSMKAQYELTQRFSAEFSIRRYLTEQEARTLKVLKKWIKDKNPHVRRLCSEGTRPKLPWAVHLHSFIKDPTPVLPILESLKDDPDLYVRRSVANHLGDIAKDHLDLVLKKSEGWLKGASAERKWVIRHALRYPAKKGNKSALRMRKLAK